jgi:hypothetical protein
MEIDQVLSLSIGLFSGCMLLIIVACDLND